MTKFLKIRQRFIVLAICVFALACNDDDSKPGQPVSVEDQTIYESATINAGLSNLLAAINSANGDLDTVLNGSGQITLIAPSNAAFEELATKLGYTNAQDMIANIDKDVLADILSYHILSGTNNASSLSGSIDTNLGETLTFGTDDDKIIVEDKTELPSTNTAGTIAAQNQMRSNGIIHTVNKVLLPQGVIDALNIDIRPNLYELTDYEGYTSLIAAVDKTGLQGALENYNVDEDGDYVGLSLFTPSNDAVDDLLDFLGSDYESIDDFDNDVEINVLKDIVSYHLFEPEIAAVDLEAGPIETMLEGNSVNIVGGGETSQIEDATATDANIEVPQIGEGAVNGEAYGIDKVLLPQAALDFVALLASPDLLSTVSGMGSLSTLEEAIILLELESDLDDTTNDSANPEEGFTYFNTATVFAPSDAAFQDLFDLMGPDYNSIADFDTDEEKEILMDIILFHITPGSLMADDLSEGELATQQGTSIEVIEKLGGGVVLGDFTNDVNANIVTADISTRNGLVHTIDKVLLPQSAVDFINSLED